MSARTRQQKSLAQSLSARYRFIPTTGHVFQSVAAGLLLAGGFFFLYQPVIEAVRSVTEEEAKVAALEAEQAALEADIEARQNEKLEQRLEDAQEALAEREQRLKELGTRYTGELKTLAADLKRNKEEREGAIALAEGLKQKLASLGGRYEALS